MGTAYLDSLVKLKLNASCTALLLLYFSNMEIYSNNDLMVYSLEGD